MRRPLSSKCRASKHRQQIKLFRIAPIIGSLVTISVASDPSQMWHLLCCRARLPYIPGIFTPLLPCDETLRKLSADAAFRTSAAVQDLHNSIGNKEEDEEEGRDAVEPG
mmetsp:Transcript_29227/g.53690  ORF Transcript_29227/g.53690 Transcript_29227/m.53690 type:complete len:109 (+) Transcript_29227:104-430(+)